MPQGSSIRRTSRAWRWLARRQPAGDGAELRGRRGSHVSLPARAGRGHARDRHMLPPTLYFFIAFNLIVFTTNLMSTTTGSGCRALVATGGLVVGRPCWWPTDQADRLSRRRCSTILYRTVFYLDRVGFAHPGAVHPPRDRPRGLRWLSARLSMSSRGGASPPSDLALHLLPVYVTAASSAAGGPDVPCFSVIVPAAPPDASPTCAL